MKHMVRGFFCLALAAGVSIAASAAGTLPAGYARLTYIETTAEGPYINTRYKPNAGTDIELKGYMPIEKNETNRNRVFYWSRVGNGTVAAFALIINGKTNVRAYRQSQGASATGVHPSFDLTEPLSNEIVYSTADGWFTINGQRQQFTTQMTGTVPELYIFTLNNGGSVLDSQTCVSGAQLEYFRILENGVVKRDFVPCCRERDAAVGLYDVSGQSGEGDAAFYGSAKDGAAFKAGRYKLFTVGAIPAQVFDGVTPCTPKPVVRDVTTHQVMVEGQDYEMTDWEKNNWLGTAYVRIVGLGKYAGDSERVAFTISARLPKGYVPVKYLRSSSKLGNAYIDTGCTVGSGSRVSLGFQMEEAGDFSPVFGARTAQGANQFYLNGAKVPHDYWTMAYGSKAVTTNLSVLGSHYFKLEGNVWQLDDSVTTLQDEEFTSCSAYVFNLNSGGTPSTNYAKMDLYQLTIWDKDGKMVRNFVPCRRVEGNVAGLYDLCAKGTQKKFYTNDGAGAFEAGPDVIFPINGLALILR